MIELFSVGVKNGVAQFVLNKGFKVLNRVEEGGSILMKHQDELIAIANELLAVLQDGADEFEEEEDYFDDEDYEDEGDEE